MTKLHIQSTRDDRSTDKLIYWLRRYGDIDINLIYDEVRIDKFKVYLSNDKVELETQDTQINSEDIYYYRRGHFALEMDQGIKDTYSDVYKNIYFPISQYLASNGPSKIGALKDNDINKLEVLHKAVDCGLSIPSTLVTSQKSELIKFIKEQGRVICKSMRNSLGPFRLSQGELVSVEQPTMEITRKMVEMENEYFAPSLFQNYIEKLLEIRSFFIGGDFFSMAIWSQKNLRTRIDCRHEDNELPNRKEPIVLPQKCRDKLMELMDKLELKKGSVDMVVTPAYEFVFLEVNPIGQYDWLDKNCNYYINKHIAEYIHNLITT